METRFSPLPPHRRFTPRRATRSKAHALPDAPSLPWGEWLLAVPLILCLLGA